MGQMRFVIPRPERLVGAAAEQAYLAGAEGIPWECQTTLEGIELILERDTRESGYLYFPWKVTGRGLLQLCSGSLMERPNAYHLPVELARGTLNRVRNQAGQWEQAGMTIPPAFEEMIHAAALIFARAATGQDHPEAAQDFAEEAIRLGLDAGDLLSREYTQQVLAIRRGQQASLGTLLGARLQAVPTGEAATRFQSAFNAAAIGTFWPDLEPQLGRFKWEATDKLVEWCRQRELRLCMGPLVHMDKHALPDWLFLDEDFEEVQTSVLAFIDEVVKRYRGKVDLWHVAAGMNLDGALEL
ncbi:MAG TPA: endo-1,4-beta-xylanase, partial [Pirellulaceae bacterium]|nr:endo-1,4-beta-xylanase [Pirellulaceae bacterium]